MRTGERTGERLDDGSALYRADLARHRAAYRFVESFFAAGPVLDLGCGTGYGADELAATGRSVVALDRARPEPRLRGSGARFVLGDLERLPFAASRVDRVASFQVIEHFADPRLYLAEIARILRPDGTALFSTPNRLESDGENPFHLREYTADELAGVLSLHFEQVEIRGIHAHGPAARYHAERLRQIRRVTRLDPMGLRRRLPRGLVDWAFARLSVRVRLGVRQSGAMEQVRDEDYRVETANGACVDLLALCRSPRPAAQPALR